MGSNSRTSYWKFPDPVEDSILNFTQNSSFRGQSAEENIAGDLKLGRLGDLNTFVDRLKNPMTSDSSSGSYKRARAHNNALHVPSCLVDGCVSDLSNCRDYHKRHKVCESHSKTPLVTIGGQERRFCQQCSRFHSLGEFDEAKRSCRKRLDGHNRRRRKDKSDSLSLNSSKFNPAHQDSKFISYGTQHFPNSSLESSSWNNAIKGGIDEVINSGRASSLLSSLRSSETCGPSTYSIVPNASHCGTLAMESISVVNKQ